MLSKFLHKNIISIVILSKIIPETILGKILGKNNVLTILPRTILLVLRWLPAVS